MIHAREIGYRIGERQLVQNVTMDIAPGVLHLIIGPNGAGKSTLIKLLSGQLAPHTGTIDYAGKPLGSFSVAALARIRAVLSQNMEISFPVTVWEVVMMGRYPHFTGKPGATDIQAAREAMAFFNVEDFANRDYSTLSGGEKQRVQFARVLTQIWYPVPGQCRYLFLDEPLTFLDVHYQHDFMHLVLQLLHSRDLIIIGVVHDLNLASKYAGDITLLNNGSVLASGTPQTVLCKEIISIAYKLEPTIIFIGENQYILF